MVEPAVSNCGDRLSGLYNDYSGLAFRPLSSSLNILILLLLFSRMFFLDLPSSSGNSLISFKSDHTKQQGMLPLPGPGEGQGIM